MAKQYMVNQSISHLQFLLPVKNLDGAISFGDFILSTNGRNILKDQGLNPIKPITEGEIANIPSSLRSIVEEENSATILSQGSKIIILQENE